jgi:hypothetical protein
VDIKMDFREMGWRLVEGSCENGNESSGSIKYWRNS